MNKATSKHNRHEGICAPGYPEELRGAGANVAAVRGADNDVQRLRSLVNILNMRIELLESELASYRASSNDGEA